MAARRAQNIGHAPMLVLWLLSIALGARFVAHAVRATDRPASGFVGHYVASRDLIEGAGSAALYTDSVFIAHVGRFEPGVTDIFGANPPTVALTALPVALLDYRLARRLWTAAIALLWLGALLWLAVVLLPAPHWRLAFIGLGLAFDPAFANLRDAQMHVLVLCLMLVAWTGWRRSSALRTGPALGLVLGLKSTGFVFWPLLAAQRRWRALFWAAATFALLAAVVTVFLGTDAWIAFIARARALAGSGSLSVTAYQSITSLVRRLTVQDPQWNPAPLLALGGGGIALSWVIVLGMLGVSLRASAGRSDDSVFAAFAALSLATSPVSLDTHYTLAIFPVAVLIARYQGRMLSLRGMMLAAATAMIALDLPYRSPLVGWGMLVVFAYPKLYGAILLWYLCLRRDQTLAGEHGI